MLQYNINFTGRLTKDPTCAQTQTGRLVTHFDVAVDTGTRQNERTEFVHCSVFGGADNNGGLAKACFDYLSKGKMVQISGYPTASAYTSTNSGEAVASMNCRVDSIMFLSPRGDAAQNNAQTAPAATVQTGRDANAPQARAPQAAPRATITEVEDDDTLPF